MKPILFYLLLILLPATGKSQTAYDSILHQWDTAKTNSSKGKILFKYSFSQGIKNSVKMNTFLKLLPAFIKKKDNAGIGYDQFAIATTASLESNLPVAMKYSLAALKIFEQLKDTIAILNVYSEIGVISINTENYEAAIMYSKKGMPVAKAFNLYLYSAFINNLGACYNLMHLPDSALPYAQEAVTIDIKHKDTAGLAASLGLLGETYIWLHEDALGRPFTLQSIVFAKKNGDDYSTAYSLNDLSQSFYNTAQYDSCMSYAKNALEYDNPAYLTLAIQSYKLMYQAFDKLNKQDSADRYFRLSIVLKDSVLSDEKKKNIASQNLQEQVREQEIQNEKDELEAQHRENVENTLIALGIVGFILLFLLLSHNLITNANLIRFLGVVALLMVFEFINLLIHPFLETVTNHSQVLMLLVLVCLAALLVPLHHRLEQWTVSRLIEKNKAHRLAMAKKTIEKLEENDEEHDKTDKK